jgi:predicted amidohydrolase
MSRKIGIAAVQMAAIPYDIQATLTKIDSLVEQTNIIIPWVDLLCFPELVLDAFCVFVPGYSPVKGQSIPGPITDHLCNLAAHFNKWLLPGSMSERDGDDVYNTALVISPKGEIVARYRKIFPWRPHETCKAGDTFTVFDIPSVGHFGICICYDLWFPEVARTLSWMGAEVIFQPSATQTSDRPKEMVMIQANAIFNQCYYIGVNATGEFGGGRSMIVDPNGNVLQQADQHECILSETLDLDLVSQVREYGTLGLCQTWKSLRDDSITFPPYSQGIASSPMVKSLGPMAFRNTLIHDEKPPT